MSTVSDAQQPAGEGGRIEVVTTTERQAPDGVAGSLSTAELIKRASDQLSTLVRDELALARAEMSAKAKRAGVGAGLLGTAGVISLYGVFGVLAGVVLLVARVLPDWAAALVVGAGLLVVAGLFGLVGIRQVKRMSPPVPEGAVASIREDVSALKAAARRKGGHR
ncbi:phage holin family protein [Rugosimonospora africana]|uniref:Holin-X, holin superfamily III n=1 Tax=Rugosimonospora africana TaxID=556532 RepID=A0A8J3QUM4_9ACTN|nr:phage holin family protein [Rugosimonospora africana]GIH16327.1 hypothetical protein Raf01_44990 [Rugosimonospora africana]